MPSPPCSPQRHLSTIDGNASFQSLTTCSPTTILIEPSNAAAAFTDDSNCASATMLCVVSARNRSLTWNIIDGGASSSDLISNIRLEDRVRVIKISANDFLKSVMQGMVSRGFDLRS